MTNDGRPSIDVHARLDAAEWRELFRCARPDALRHTITGLLAAAVPFVAWYANQRGAQQNTVTVLAVAGVLAVLGFSFAYARLGPWLASHAAAERLPETHWIVRADRLQVYRAGHHLDLAWSDIRAVVLTRRLIVLQPRTGGDPLGLPRRVASEIGESLLVGWARAAGLEPYRRAGAGRTATPRS